MRNHKVLTDTQKKSRTIILNIICVILTVLFLGCLVGQLTMRSALKQKDIDNAIENIDYSKLTVQLRDEQMPFDQYINDYYILDETVTDEDIDNLLKNSTAGEYLVEKYNELTQYMLGGSYKMPTISAEEIASLLDDNKDMIYNDSPIRFLSDDHAELIVALEAPLNSFNASLSESNMISFMKLFASIAMIILSIVLLLIVLIVWMLNSLKINEKNYPAIRNFGITMFAASAIISISMLAYSSNPTVVTDFTPALDLKNAGNEIFTNSSFVAMVTAGVGIVLAVIGFIMGANYKKNYVDESADNLENINSDGDNVFSVLDNKNENAGVDTVYNSDDENIVKPVQPEKEPDEIDQLIDEIDNTKPATAGEENIPVDDKTFEPDTAESEDETADNIAENIKKIKEQKQVGKHEAEPVQEEIVMPEISATAAIPINGRVCPKCGKTNLSRNLFCSECGELLK